MGAASVAHGAAMRARDTRPPWRLPVADGAGIQETGPVTEFSPLSFAGNEDGDVMVFLRYALTVSATGKDVPRTSITTGGCATARSSTTVGPRTRH